MQTKIIDTEFGIFVGRRVGEVIKISVPASTSNDWMRDTTFLDLPSMDHETFDNFAKCICEMSRLFGAGE